MGAAPSQILAVMSNMTASLEQDGITVDSYLVSQLEDIARASQGKVPLHGRLFAQWLHYVLPHQCPFPHKSGTARASTSPKAYGSGYLVTETEKSASYEPVEEA